MTTTTISPKFQIVIPKEVREKAQLISGMKFEVVVYNNRIELIPLRSMKDLKGILRGIDTRIVRE
ncbi:MAG: AbrB/MazE/SpoVT family DNA-binding domain-containing protein [Bacteroidota bacterium]